MISVNVFYCYAHEDKQLRSSLEKHLGNLKQQKLVTDWCDRNINAGKEWNKEIDVNLNTANIILLLISPDFISSKYCYSVEMKRALERHENGTARVIPIILRPVDYEGAPFSHLQALPTGAIPVTDRKWRNRDEAFFDIAQEIRKVVKELHCEQWLDQGNIHFYRQQYPEALTAFEHANHFNPNNANAYVGKGQTFYELGSSDNALRAFEQAIQLDANNTHAYEGKAKALLKINRWSSKQDILNCYAMAIQLDAKNTSAYIGQGKALLEDFPQRNKEALLSFEKAIEFSPIPLLEAYEGKAKSLNKLKLFKEARSLYEQIIQEFPDQNYLYVELGNVLSSLNQYEEAIAVYKKAFSYGFVSVNLLTGWGNALFEQKKDQEALDTYELAIQLFEEQEGRFSSCEGSDAYKGKGTVLQKLALEALNKAEALDPPF